MIGEGIELHIKGVRVDWDRIEEDSYLRNIDSITGMIFNAVSCTHSVIIYRIQQNNPL